MRLSYLSSLYLILILLRRSEAATRHHHQNRWGDEATGEESNLPADQQDTYKQTLLQYVFQTGEPPNLTDDAEVPYVMDKLYNLVADKASGEQRDSTPFSVDYIHGLEDYYGKSCGFSESLFSKLNLPKVAKPEQDLLVH